MEDSHSPNKHTLPAKMGYQLVRSVEEDTEDCAVAAGAEKISAIELQTFTEYRSNPINIYLHVLTST